MAHLVEDIHLELACHLVATEDHHHHHIGVEAAILHEVEVMLQVKHHLA